MKIKKIAFVSGTVKLNMIFEKKNLKMQATIWAQDLPRSFELYALVPDRKFIPFMPFVRHGFEIALGDSIKINLTQACFGSLLYIKAMSCSVQLRVLSTFP